MRNISFFKSLEASFDEIFYDDGFEDDFSDNDGFEDSSDTDTKSVDDIGLVTDTDIYSVNSTELVSYSLKSDDINLVISSINSSLSIVLPLALICVASFVALPVIKRVFYTLS